MKSLLGLSRFIDALNERIGRFLLWLVLIMTLISAGNAVLRYGFNFSSNAFLEVQWFLYSIVFLGAAGYTLKHNQHVRIDLVSGWFSRKTQAWIDVFGTVFMMLPVCMIILWYGWNAAVESYRVSEMSGDAGGLVRWPIKFVVPIAFFLLIVQGLSELVKRIAFLGGLAREEAEHHSEIEEHLKIIQDQPQSPGEVR